ncbi:hypothetical protein OUZ56_031967 [Daphnia magna]|uniref:Uncharacterized protein n=1 Tax=Daphnia magna TaxID=35525 RepID=A0ABQ9ZVU1_9CRUS|nr:hypothetical protein OUZ56_031967 [Daphnia magna]
MRKNKVKQVPNARNREDEAFASPDREMPQSNLNKSVNDDVTQLTSFLHRSCERQDTSLQLQATFG